jgi:L-threonylcarbamoyladenylate synthase
MLNRLFSEIQTQIEQGISILIQGGLVAFPTDTVYGLGACADNELAVARVYKVKERPGNMALPLLLAHSSQITAVAESVPPIAWLLADKFLPGALTIVLPKSKWVPGIVAGGGKTIAVRIPAHPVPVALAEAVGPIVRSQLGDKIDLVIDGGQCPGGRESTIVDVTGEVPVVLREGAISREELRKVCQVI